MSDTASTDLYLDTAAGVIVTSQPVEGRRLARKGLEIDVRAAAVLDMFPRKTAAKKAAAKKDDDD